MALMHACTHVGSNEFLKGLKINQWTKKKNFWSQYVVEVHWSRLNEGGGVIIRSWYYIYIYMHSSVSFFSIGLQKKKKKNRVYIYICTNSQQTLGIDVHTNIFIIEQCDDIFWLASSVPWVVSWSHLIYHSQSF
jgi:hypothetical protein